jgi:Rod binding domain-containing protein
MTDAILPMSDITTALNTAPSLSAKLSPNAGNVDKTSQDFEAMFATQMLQPMFEGLGVDPAFGGGHGEEVMRSFLLQEYGKLLAKGNRLGIAAQVKSEMLRAQESAGRQSDLRRASITSDAQNAYAQASTRGGQYVAH